MKINLESPKKILIPRFDTFGDLVLLEGFVEKLHTSFPYAEITLLVRSGYEQISPIFPISLGLKWLAVEGNPYIYAMEQERRKFEKFLEELTSMSWDLVVFTAFNINWMDTTLANRLLDVSKIAIGPKESIDGWPNTKLTVVPVDEKSHEINKYQRLLSAITGNNETLPPPRLELQADLQERVAGLMTLIGVGGDTPYVACVPAGTQNQSGKVWPVERYAALLTWLYRVHGYTIILLGHQNESDIIRSLVLMLENQNIKVSVWLGRDGEITLLAGILKRAHLYVGNDTGPMHIAAALGTPVVGVFGGGTFPRFMPIGERAIGVVGELPCFGCMWNCRFSYALCMRLVSVEDVKKAVQMVLDVNPVCTNYLPVMAGCGERLE